jgi:hypothetical protein
VKVKQTSLPEGCRWDEWNPVEVQNVSQLSHTPRRSRSNHFRPFCTRSLWLRSHFVTVYGVSGPEPFNLLQWVSDGAACKWIRSKD